ncbi:unnamed protein product [Owenia fusiformis]|uniref:PPM-type phosphatase domain-containing protein n=1 Tax=Owenia fusiformis TaxID=6347 RepID=A0A8S4NGK6_OWEFU|nr:unnamed protein product [Owenia fusiformis]
MKIGGVIWRNYRQIWTRLSQLDNGHHKRVVFSQHVANRCDDAGSTLSYPKLTPQQVSSILRNNENTFELKRGKSVRSFDTNQLASNDPIEDRRSEARLTQTDGLMFGVFDGHAGCACAQAVSERLFEYIAVSLLPPHLLDEFNHALKDRLPSVNTWLLNWYRHDNDYFNTSMASLYRSNLHRYVTEMLSTSCMEDDHEFVMWDALTSAFVRLDQDISTEAMPGANGLVINPEMIDIAFSGTVACVAHIDGPHLHIANSGDSMAVLGSYDEDQNRWHATELSKEHNAQNLTEVKRIKDNHPSSESNFVIKNDRLLGQLAPLRAFGDVRYKWQHADLKKLTMAMNTPYAQNFIPPNYYTPPYLTVSPEIKYHRLRSQDKFLILATDGLWDMLSPDMVIRLVGQHMTGKQTYDPYVPNKGVKLKDINSVLLKRKSGIENRAIDKNSATHLIRNALGTSEFGVQHNKLSLMLSIPQDIVRLYRDDITVTVIFFDQDFLRTCPA